MSETKLLAGGNPQIPKGDGDEPVQKYLAAMPGWKQRVGKEIDAIVTRTVPGVKKTVKWNSPLYGNNDGGWFLSMHCFENYVKVTFFEGALLKPVPPGESKQKDVRYFDVRESENLESSNLEMWIEQASRLPDTKM